MKLLTKVIGSHDFASMIDAGVSGGTASGKTTVCDMIIQQLHDHRVVLVNQVYKFLSTAVILGSVRVWALCERV